MCGIIGINSQEGDIIPSIITGLKNLEYRGYDSAGIASVIEEKLEAIKVQGKILSLEDALKDISFKSNLAIGHTRWATHGVANKVNAHPHQTNQVSVVHNGIIENYISIKNRLVEEGHVFSSQTDSEVIPHLITYYLNKSYQPLEAVKEAIKELDGAFSIAVIFLHYPELMISARKGSPLVIGYGDNKNIVASDAYALAFLTNHISYLEEGDVAAIYPDQVIIYDKDNQQVKRKVIVTDNNVVNISKENFSHYMLKEIFQQPTIIADLINKYCDLTDNNIEFENIAINWKALNKITIIACGSSYIAALTCKYWLEKYGEIFVEVDIASEFRYRNSYLPENGLCIFLSQSGETADTLAALRYVKEKGQKTLSIINVKESSLDREADFSIQCFAGPEISVASTKGFTTQLVVLLLISLFIARKREKLTSTQLAEKLIAVAEIPGRMAEVLNNADAIKLVSSHIASSKDVIFIGRNYIYPIALEGALKLKELSYIHAEAIAAGELKHGPIALVDENMPIIVLAPKNSLFDKISSNAQEISARGGKLITFSSKEGNEILKELSSDFIEISGCDELIEPIIYSVPMQLLAYYVAVKKGTDVDQPRNLAKSVTVE